MNKLLTTTLLGGALLCTAASFSLAQAPADLPAQTPAPDALSHWMAMGENSRVALENADDKRTLRFSYEVKAGQLSALVTPLTPGALGEMGSLTLNVKADHSTSLLVSLEEEGGGRFSAPFALVADKWQTVQLTLADFTLQTDGDAPPDADEKLDLNRVKNLSLIDFSQTFAAAMAAPNSPFGGVKLGAHSLWMDAMTINPATAATAPMQAGMLDDFKRPQASWLGVGNVALERESGGVLDGPALKVSYRQTAGQIAGLIKPLPTNALAGSSSLNFDMVSLERAILIVQLEERGGGKYNLPVEVPGQAKFTQVNLPFAQFKPADDSKDDNGRLDLAQVKQLLILDAAGMMKAREGDNTLWMGAISAR